VAALPLNPVAEKEAQLGKTPAVVAVILPALALLRPFVDVRQVLYNDDAARTNGIDDV
jgi:hypothetical protein